jgi:hypothetical protein
VPLGPTGTTYDTGGIRALLERFFVPHQERMCDQNVAVSGKNALIERLSRHQFAKVRIEFPVSGTLEVVVGIISESGVNIMISPPFNKE